MRYHLTSTLTRWTVWVNSERWWWTGRPGVLRFMGSQRVGHNWATELNWTELRLKRRDWWHQVLVRMWSIRNCCWRESKMDHWYGEQSLVAQMVKNLPVMQETWVRSLGWEDPLEKGMATQSSILAWRIPWTEEPLCPWGHKESDKTEQPPHTHMVVFMCRVQTS